MPIHYWVVVPQVKKTRSSANYSQLPAIFSSISRASVLPFLEAATSNTRA
jgi:hypothetical protein